MFIACSVACNGFACWRGAGVQEKQAAIPASPILNSLAGEAVLAQVVDVGVEGRGVQEVGSGSKHQPQLMNPSHF